MPETSSHIVNNYIRIVQITGKLICIYIYIYMYQCVPELDIINISDGYVLCVQ